MKFSGIHLAFVLSLTLLAGCATKKEKIKPPPPPPAAENYFSNPSRGQPMRRVAVLPLNAPQVPPETMREVTAAFNSELNKKALFEVAPVSQSELETMCGERQLSSVEQIPGELPGKLRQKLGAEGVLLIDITHFNSYRPVSIGVRAKLIDISNGQIRWAFDYVFDAGHPAVAEAAKKFQVQYADQRQSIPDDGGSILLSPARFSKYVAAQTFASLQKGP